MSSAALPAPREGSLTLSLGYGADLDSAAENWDVRLDGYNDLGFNDGGPGNSAVLFSDDNQIAPIPYGEPGSQAACRRDAAYQAAISQDQLTEDAQFCVKTDQGKDALLTLRSPQRDSTTGNIDRITLDVVVWPKA